MYIDTVNDSSRDSNATYDNEEMLTFESDELFSDQTMNSASKLLNSGE